MPSHSNKPKVFEKLSLPLNPLLRRTAIGMALAIIAPACATTPSPAPTAMEMVDKQEGSAFFDCDDPKNLRISGISSALEILDIPLKEFIKKYDFDIQQVRKGRYLIIFQAKSLSGSPELDSKQPGTDADTGSLGRKSEKSPEMASKTFAKLKKVVEKYLGTPYKHSGMGQEDGGFGPSGFVIKVMKEGMNIDLPRGAASQSQVGGEKIPFENLKPGDLIFFSANRRTINSVAIYMGNNQMAIVERRVQIMDINSWFRKHFSYGKRFMENPPEDTRTSEAVVSRPDKPQKITGNQKIAENLSEDELNGMPKATWEKLFAARLPFMGRPYKGRGRNGMDCSGLTSSVYDKWADILKIEQLKISRYARSTETQGNLGDLVPRAKGKGLEVFKNLKIGDLIIFSISSDWRKTNKKGSRKKRPGSKPSHVAIYIGNGKMLHAGTSKGVTIVDLDAWDDYWVDYFVFGRRLLYWENGKPVIKK